MILGSYHYRISVFYGISQSQPHLSFLWSRSLASAHSGVATPPDRGRCGACAAIGGFKSSKAELKSVHILLFGMDFASNNCTEVYGGFLNWETALTIGFTIKNDQWLGWFWGHPSHQPPPEVGDAWDWHRWHPKSWCLPRFPWPCDRLTNKNGWGKEKGRGLKCLKCVLFDIIWQ